MRACLGGLLAGMVLLAGCTSPRSSGIQPLDAGQHALTATSRDLGPAAELAFGEATGFCTGQGLQTQLLKTRINPSDYHLVFRCVGDARAVPGSPAEGRPVLLGQAFATPASAAPAPSAAGLTPRRAGPGLSGLPAQPPTLGALAAAARQPVPDGSPPQRDLFGRLFGADDPPAVAIGDPPRTNGVAAPQPLARPRAFETLPSVTGLPGGPPHRALTPLPPVGEPSRPWAFLTDGPTRLQAPAGGATPVAEPAGFWDMRRR